MPPAWDILVLLTNTAFTAWARWWWKQKQWDGGGWSPCSKVSSASSLPSLTKHTVLNQPRKSVGDYSLDGKTYIIIMNELATTVISYKRDGTRVIEKLKDDESKDLRTNLPCKSRLAPANSAKLHWNKDYRQDQNLVYSPAFHHIGNIKKIKSECTHWKRSTNILEAKGPRLQDWRLRGLCVALGKFSMKHCHSLHTDVKRNL